LNLRKKTNKDPISIQSWSIQLDLYIHCISAYSWRLVNLVGYTSPRSCSVSTGGVLVSDQTPRHQSHTPSSWDSMSYATAAMSAQPQWPETNRKRERDDEHEDIAIGGMLGFTEHRSVCCRPALPRFNIFPPVPHNSCSIRSCELTAVVETPPNTPTAHVAHLQEAIHPSGLPTSLSSALFTTTTAHYHPV
jgi:hypothetical protein